MSARIKTVTAAAALLAIAACSNGGGIRNPAPIRNYGPEAGNVAQGSRNLVSGRYVWNQRLADAQSQARASGKLILVASTKPGCTLCEQFKNSTVPAVSAEAAAMSVGYVYDITRPEVRQIDQILRANLKEASLMPLIGFLTPDLRWVHGFWGGRTVQQFRGDMETAASRNPMRTASAGPVRTVGDENTLAAVTNEFGEKEWSLPGDVWPAGHDPEPIDAIMGSPDQAPDAAFTPAGPAPTLADATPLPPPAAPAAGGGLPPLGGDLETSPPPPAPANLAADQRNPGGRVIASNQLRAPDQAPYSQPPSYATSAREPVVVSEPRPARDAALLPPAGPVRTPTGTLVPPAPIERRWSAPASEPRPSADPRPLTEEDIGLQALSLAFEQIQGARYDAARATLDQVRQRYPDTSLAREASKGSIALYNAKRIRTASNEAEKERYRVRARRDLGTSMWGGLFSS